jgi:TnpA family transposase
VPVEFLSDDEVLAYEGFGSPLPEFSADELQAHFTLDDEDRRLALTGRRGDHNRLGFALQLVTVRYLGLFLDDPLAAPWSVVDFLAMQLEIADPSCVKSYTDPTTRYRQIREIKRSLGLRDFSKAADEVSAWVYAQAWSTGDKAKTLFGGVVGWLRQENIVLPGVTSLTRLVASARDAATNDLYATLWSLLTPAEAQVLEGLLARAEGDRLSVLETLRRGQSSDSGKAMEAALMRVATIAGLGLGATDVSAVPPRRMRALAKYGMGASADMLRRHGPHRKLATLLATVIWLEGAAIDDALLVLDLLMASRLVGPAKRMLKEEKLRRYPSIARDSARLAVAVEVLLEALDWGEATSLAEVWEAIDSRVPRRDLEAALAYVTGVVPPPEADADGEVRALLVNKIQTVRGFLPMLCEHIRFGATKQAKPLLKAMAEVGTLIKTVGPVKKAPLSKRKVNKKLVLGSWKRLVFDKPGLPKGAADRSAYVICVLEQFHQAVKDREIYAVGSHKWGDPRAHLLSGKKWAAAKPTVLTALRLPEDPAELLGGHEKALDQAYREVAGRFEDNDKAAVDKDGRLHIAALQAIPEPPSLVDLRGRVAAMLPKVPIGDVVLEVMGRYPAMVEAFTSITGGESRMDDLPMVLTAVLTARSLNIGFSPIVASGQFTRRRLVRADHQYLHAGTLPAANVPLIEGQADIDLARAWGGGLVAAVDGMRFVVPTRTIHARPNPKYWGIAGNRAKWSTWLNMINDQGVGTADMVLAGTPKDSLHLIDLMYRQQGGALPEVIVTDMGSYSDVVFGMVHLLGKKYRPSPADLPDERLWRADAKADYGPLNTAARGRLDTERCSQHWPEMLRLVGSIHLGEVSAYDAMRLLQREGAFTPLGQAFAMYGRVFKSLHLLAYIDDEGYRRDIKGIRNLQEGRHGLAEHLYHGRRGGLYEHYIQGMEDHLGGLGLVLNCVTLWNTLYMDAAIKRLRAQGYPVRDEDVLRLSPYAYKHIQVHGTYTFRAPNLSAGLLPLRDPDAPDEDD